MQKKQIILILTLLLTTSLCFGQRNHILFLLYPEELFSLLDSGFSEKPYARYTSIPSFDKNYAFSVEKIDEKNYIISNKFSENFFQAGYSKADKMGIIRWDIDNTKKVKLNTSKKEIDNDLYLKIGELFELLANKTINELRIPIVVDGTNYYFETTDKNGEIRMEATASPNKESIMGRFVNICEDLFSVGLGKNIDQTKIIMEIILLINDLKNDVLPTTSGLDSI